MNYIIERTRAGVTCTIGGKSVSPRNDLYNHSPDGFEFGFGGSGPAQLALGILADAVGDEMALQKYHQGVLILTYLKQFSDLMKKGCRVVSRQEVSLGNWARGRFAWKFVRGRQGLWEWDEA